MRLLVYTDYAYHGEDGRVFAERAFALFLGRLAESLGEMTIGGRLDPRPSRARYELPPEVRFVALPYYESLSRPATAIVAIARSLARLWRSLDNVDAVWLLGPHPLALAFAPLALLRRRRVLLGVRQDTPSYVASRHAHRPLLRGAGWAMDAAYRLLARRCPTVVVGGALASRYRRAPRLLEIAVSLVEERDVVCVSDVLGRSYADELTLLCVGRLDEEKNPLLLADVLAALERAEPGRWRLLVCGEGSLARALERRLGHLGVAERASVAGYVPFGELRERYRNAHLLISTSWTEGFPQVLVEAFAAGLPAICTDVGGIAAMAGEAVELIPPGDAEAAAAAARRLAGDRALRERRVRAALVFASEHTIEAEVARLARFIADA